MLNNICLSFNLWGALLVTGLNLKLVFWSQPVLNLIHWPYIQPKFHQFISENVTGNGVENLSKGKMNRTQCLPLIHHDNHLIIELYVVGHTWFPLYKSLLMTSNYFLVLHVVGNVFEEDSVHCFHHIKERLTGICCTGSSFFSFRRQNWQLFSSSTQESPLLARDFQS